jgi:outer membrane lipoprotein-sorting protein
MRRFLSRAALVVAVSAAAVAAHAQTADEIVARNLQAKGGADRLKALTSLKMSGRITLQGRELPITIYTKRPNFSRQEMVLPEGRIVQAFDGTSAWVINPMMGPAPQQLPPAASEMMKNSSEFDSALVDYKSKGNTIDLIGTEKVDDTDVYHLKLTKKGGQVQHYYLNTKTGLEVKMSQEMDGPMGKQTFQTELSDYQPLEGIMMPRTVKQSLGTDTVVQIKLDKIELNSIPDDELFRMPKK